MKAVSVCVGVFLLTSARAATVVNVSAEATGEDCNCQKTLEEIKNDIPSSTSFGYHNVSTRLPHDDMNRISCEDINKFYQNYQQADSYFLPMEHGYYISPIVYVGYDLRQNAENEEDKIVMHVWSVPSKEILEDCEGERFGASFGAQMRKLGARVTDEKGHILAKQLCGPARWYNMAPQTRYLNRNFNNAGGYGWINLEKYIKSWVLCNCGTASINVYLNYQVSTVRPSGFKVCVDFSTPNNGVMHHKNEYFNNDIFD